MTLLKVSDTRDDFCVLGHFRDPATAGINGSLELFYLKNGRHMSITVYTKPSCVQCNATYRALDSKGIRYNIVDMSQDEEALEMMKNMGYLQAPVVIVGEKEDLWSGFRPDKIADLAGRLFS